jgi:hypothetical protein
MEFCILEMFAYLELMLHQTDGASVQNAPLNEL